MLRWGAWNQRCIISACAVFFERRTGTRVHIRGEWKRNGCFLSKKGRTDLKLFKHRSFQNALYPSRTHARTLSCTRGDNVSLPARSRTDEHRKRKSIHAHNEDNRGILFAFLQVKNRKISSLQNKTGKKTHSKVLFWTFLLIRSVLCVSRFFLTSPWQVTRWVESSLVCLEKWSHSLSTTLLPWQLGR